MNKSFWIVLAVCILALVGIFIVSGGKASNDASGEFAYSEPILDQQSHDIVKGTGEKGTIVEYADFQCPYCAAYAPVLQQLEQAYGDDIKIIFRNFPITSTHPQAMAAHRAAGAANEQGKFWEMHDLIYANQEGWAGNDNAASVFETLASDLGLDMDKYKEDLGSDRVFAKINSDLSSGSSIGVSATPTLFFNGEKLEEPPVTLEEWQAIIDQQ